ncbi:STAS domain-containing protein [Modestobacter sp. NPDC049651]|uniref:STAS domain-containing protein n=1 Tax=unclassified Modestobacter TaxID=2643866 RepID=UPI0033CCEA74
MDESTVEPTVEFTGDQDDEEAAEVRVVGEMTEQVRRPLVRAMTDLLLSRPRLKRLRLDLCEVGFLDSQGMAALVQVERMAQPRGVTVEIALKDRAVARPLQLSGLWHRFTILDHREGTPQQTHEPLPPGREHS